MSFFNQRLSIPNVSIPDVAIPNVAIQWVITVTSTITTVQQHLILAM